MLAAIPAHLLRRADALHATLVRNLPTVMTGWLVVALLGGMARMFATPVGAGGPSFSTAAPYILLMVAPLLSMALALHWFRDGQALPQPQWRLARVGRWRDLSLTEAKRQPLYGTSGLMLSLLIGMLLNVPIRAAEYLLAMPALGGDVPHWLATLHFLMTLDVVLMSSLYVIAFVAALKKVPLFPRLLFAVWLIDITLQMLTASQVASTNVPTEVAMGLKSLLELNIQKVLISMTLWTPYLILSKRVNVTFRHRIPA